ncbi:unnamed protein product, partial [Pylaiella littoralis]
NGVGTALGAGTTKLVQQGAGTNGAGTAGSWYSGRGYNGVGTALGAGTTELVQQGAGTAGEYTLLYTAKLVAAGWLIVCVLLLCAYAGQRSFAGTGTALRTWCEASAA